MNLDWEEWGVRLLALALVVGGILGLIALDSSVYPTQPNFSLTSFTVTDQRVCVHGYFAGGFISAVFRLVNSGSPGHARVIVRVDGTQGWVGNYSLGRGGALSAQATVNWPDCANHTITGKVDAQWY